MKFLNLSKQKQRGFTIVELLIVIVVIAILAAITIVAYNGVQARGRDARRVSDMQAIVKALEMYKADNGQYPVVAYSGTGSLGGWEVSAKEASGEFLAPLKNYGFSSGVPVDPINDATDADFNTARTNNHYTYAYYRYPAGNNGCDASRGAFYVLGIMRTDVSGNAAATNSPGFSCSYNWQATFSWVTGGYEN